jgi:hypothetical protein
MKKDILPFEWNPELVDGKIYSIDSDLTLIENLVQTHYREERELKFYADKLGLTPMHLSKVVKAASRKSANEGLMTM